MVKLLPIPDGPTIYVYGDEYLVLLRFLHVIAHVTNQTSYFSVSWRFAQNAWVALFSLQFLGLSSM